MTSRHASGPDRVVRRGHAARGRQGLARRDRQRRHSTPSDSPGPAPPTAAKATPTASRARPSSSSSTTPRTAPITSTRSGGTCWATSASRARRSERDAAAIRIPATTRSDHIRETIMNDWTRREFLAAYALAAAAQAGPNESAATGRSAERTAAGEREERAGDGRRPARRSCWASSASAAWAPA